MNEVRVFGTLKSMVSNERSLEKSTKTTKVTSPLFDARSSCSLIRGPLHEDKLKFIPG